MVTTRGKRKMMSSEATHEPVWRTLANVEPCIMKNILRLVPLDDLLANVSLVCPAWRSACCELLFWNRDVLDLSATVYTADSLVRIHESDLATVGKGFFGRFKNGKDFEEATVNLLKLLKHIMEGGDGFNGSSVEAWRNSIRTIFLPYELQISNMHIIYVAERTPSVEHLILLNPTRITVSGFARAIQNWNNLKELHIGGDHMEFDAPKFPGFIEEAGRCCQDLQVLHIHHQEFRVNRVNSLVIANNLPKLKKLDFNYCHIFATGIIVFAARMSPPLEEISFHECRRVLVPVAGEDLDANGYLSGGESFSLKFLYDDSSAGSFELQVVFEDGFEPHVPNDYAEDGKGFEHVWDEWMFK